MQFRYFKPDQGIEDLVSSYYKVTIPNSVSDKMRAEIANVRFVLAGEILSDIGGEMVSYRAGETMLCGPTNQWSNVSFADGTEVFGAAITPLGWARMLKIPAVDLAQKIVRLEDNVQKPGISEIRGVFAAPTDEQRVAAADHLFATMDDADKRIDYDFLSQVTAWITSPEPNELSDFLVRCPLSSRQVERLCKKYFGSGPKLLHRKFRALHSANRLTWQELTDWQDVATTVYSDQSHFIREFKQFNGRTPSEFIKGPHLLVRETLRERLQIEHSSPFSLIG